MSWLTVFWSINVGACLTLALMYLAVWCRERESFVRLLFSCIAASAALIAAYELQLIRADTSEEYCAILRWRAVPAWACSFARRLYPALSTKRDGHGWLGSAGSLKTLTLIVNFVFTPSLYYLEINALRQLSWGGEEASIVLGTPNPWSLLNQVTLLLLLVFSADATITVWRRGDRQRALIVGGTTTFFGALVIAQFALVVWGIIQAPLFGSFAYLGIVVALVISYATTRSSGGSRLGIADRRRTFPPGGRSRPERNDHGNEEGQITLANEQAEKTFGYPREELLGRPIEMLVPERHVRPPRLSARLLCDPELARWA